LAVPPAAALIAAAGSGERLGAGGPKALVLAAGRPLIAWSVEAFAAAASVGAAVVAAPPGFEAEIASAARAAAGDRLAIAVVTGGDTRAESVARALADADAELLAVHDAARPLVTPELIEAMISRLRGDPGADGVIAAQAVTDTIKRAAEDGAVAATEPREGLWRAQTPQLFRAGPLRAAHAGDPAAAATDDSMLVELAGGRVLIEPAPPENLKVTTPADLRFAESLLRER
jgi:2-C-methyl-D-erythritol 4-phosphate cytidylyltransferase